MERGKDSIIVATQPTLVHFKLRRFEDDDYYATHKLQIQKVKGKWVVHELDYRYVTPNATT